MKKEILLVSLLLTGCNKQIVDLNYRFDKIHIYESNKCYEITSWKDYEDGEQVQVNLVGYGTILISSTDCILVADSCPFCDYE